MTEIIDVPRNEIGAQRGELTVAVEHATVRPVADDVAPVVDCHGHEPLEFAHAVAGRRGESVPGGGKHDEAQGSEAGVCHERTP